MYQGSEIFLPAAGITHIMAKFTFKEEISGKNRAIPAHP
jgi:hypothetical protein